MNKQNDLSEFAETKEFTLDYKLFALEFKRMTLYNELKKNIKVALGKGEDGLNDKNHLIRIYLYETRNIDQKINEIRELKLRK